MVNYSVPQLGTPGRGGGECWSVISIKTKYLDKVEHRKYLDKVGNISTADRFQQPRLVPPPPQIGELSSDATPKIELFKIFKYNRH